MSNKVQTFASIITQPLNIHNFLVKIPEVDVSVVVESTTFPTEKLRIIELWAHGEKVRYPGIPENDGIWKIKIPESDTGVVREQLDALKSKIYDQKTGRITIASATSVWKDVEVIARDLADNIVFSVTLHGVWLRGRDALNLSSTDPSASWKWDYEFVYQWIEDK